METRGLFDQIILDMVSSEGQAGTTKAGIFQVLEKGVSSTLDAVLDDRIERSLERLATQGVVERVEIEGQEPPNNIMYRLSGAQL